MRHSLLLFILFCWRLAHAPPPYSTDLRNAIVYQRLFLGDSASVVASRNNVSVRSVQRFVARYQRYGHVLPDWDIYDCNPGRNETVTRVDALLLIDILLENCTLYLDELQSEIQRRGGQHLSISTISRWIRRLGLSRQRLWRVKFCHTDTGNKNIMVMMQTTCSMQEKQD